MYKKVGTQVFIALVILTTLLCLFPPSAPFFLWWEAQASNYMVMLLATGLVCFFFDWKKFMFTALFCCALICFFINKRTDTMLKHPVLTKEGMDFSAAHFKVPDSEAGIDFMLDKIRQYHPDLLSLQDIDPDELYRVHQFMTHQGYEHFQFSGGELDQVRPAVYSRFALDFVRQINQRDDSSITGRIHLPKHMAYSFIQFTTAMPSRRSFSPGYLKSLSQQIHAWNSPAIALGDFSCVPWALSLSVFKHQTALQDSRRIVKASTAGEYMGLFEKPTFHILHSAHLHCIDFDIIRGENRELLGIMGTYQLADEGDQDVPQKN